MTASLTVAYPRHDGARFDFNYYRDRHTPLVRQVWSPQEVRVTRGVSAPDGGPAPYLLLCEIVFASRAELDAALAGPQTGEVFADVAAFTDVQPVAQVSEPLQ